MYRLQKKCLVSSNKSTERICFRKWVTEKTTRPGAKRLMYTVKITSLKKIYCTIPDLVKVLNDMLMKFLKHSYVTNHQFQAISQMKESLQKNEVLFILVFSENYNCKYGQEIQSAHFGASKKQITLLTGGYYYKTNSDEVQFQSFVSLSDCLDHDACTAWALINPVLTEMKKKTKY